MKWLILLMVWMSCSYSMAANLTATACDDPLEPNNTGDQAYSVNLVWGEYTHENLCLIPGDKDWFKFTFNTLEYYVLIEGYNSVVEGAYGLDISVNAGFSIESFERDGSTDTKIHLFNSVFEELAFDDDGGEGYFSRIMYTPIGCVDRDEPNNTSSDAMDLGIASIIDKEDLCLSAGDNDWYTFSYSGQIFYLRITGYSTSTEGAYGLSLERASGAIVLNTYETEGSTDTKLYLYNSSLTQIAFDDDGGNGYFSHITYNIPSECMDPLEPNNSSDQAFNLGTITSYDNANLCLTAAEEDWLRFTYSGQEYYIRIMGYRESTEGPYGLTFSLSGNTAAIETIETTDGVQDTKMYLYNSTMQQIAFDDDGGSGYFSRIVQELEGGGCEDPLEPNDNSEQAFDLGAASIYNNADLCLTAGEEDWLKFTYRDQEYYIRIMGYRTSVEGPYGLDFNLSGNTVTIETIESTDGIQDTKMYLYNSTMQQIAFNDDGGSGYFSRIVYKLEDGAICVDATEPNNSFETMVDLGWNYDNANLCLTPGDEDWFYISGFDEGFYTVVVKGYSSETKGAYGLRFIRTWANMTIETYETNGSTDTQIFIYRNGTSSLADFDDDGGEGLFSRIEWNTWSCDDPLESNNIASKATNLGTSTSYVNYDLCLIAGDKDWYKFMYNNQLYYFMIESSSEIAYGDYSLTFTRTGNNIDIDCLPGRIINPTPRMYLYNSSLEQLAFNDGQDILDRLRIIYTLFEEGCNDPFEPNGDYSQAFGIENYITSYTNSNLCLTAGDEDWIKFMLDDGNYYYIQIMGYHASTEGEYGLRFSRSDYSQAVSIETFETNGVTDTKMTLFASDQITELDFDDDGGSGYFSLINYALPASDSRTEQITSVEDDFIEEAFSIFPNPTKGNFTIVMADSNRDESLTLEIIDVAGRIMVQKEIHSRGDEFREDFNLSDQPAGIYFINLKGADFHQVGKVLVLQ